MFNDGYSPRDNPRYIQNNVMMMDRKEKKYPIAPPSSIESL